MFTEFYRVSFWRPRAARTPDGDVATPTLLGEIEAALGFRLAAAGTGTWRCSCSIFSWPLLFQSCPVAFQCRFCLSSCRSLELKSWTNAELKITFLGISFKFQSKSYSESIQVQV